MKKLAMVGIILAAAIVPGMASANSYPVGDANCSGVVTIADANLVIDVILERPGAAFGDCGARVDINCSGTVTPVDAYLISRIVTSGYTPPASCG